MVTHRQAARLFEATRSFGFGADDVWTLFHSYAFDFSVWELWGALLHGGRLVVMPRWVSRSPEAFLDLLEREGVTVLNQTPSAFYQLLRADDGRPLGLRWVIFGGEALEPPKLRPWFERHGDERPVLVNMYGITETTVHVTLRPLTRRATARGVIGRAARRPAPVSARSAARAGARGGGGGDLRGRRGSGARLSRPARADRRALRAGPVRRRAGGPALPLGRPGPLAAGRRAGIPGPRRPAAQGPRLPHRAGRDRGRARPPPGGGAGGGRRPPSVSRGRAPRRLRGGPRRRLAAGGGRAAGAPDGASAGAVGARASSCRSRPCRSRPTARWTAAPSTS